MTHSRRTILIAAVVIAALLAVFALAFLSNGGVAKSAPRTTTQRIADKWKYDHVRRKQQLKTFPRGGDRNCYDTEQGRTETIAAEGMSILDNVIFTVFTRVHWCVHNGNFRVISWDQWHDIAQPALNPWYFVKDLDPNNTNGEVNCCPPIEWKQRRMGSHFQWRLGPVGQDREIGTWQRIGNYVSYYQEGVWG